MKKLIAQILVLSLILVTCSVGLAKSKKPVVGIAWTPNTESIFFKNPCRALEAAGIRYVFLGQIRSDDLKYDAQGKLLEGVDVTGALTESAGKLVRCNSWQNSNAAEELKNISAVIFTGGEDISPSLYYRQEKWHGIEAERDYNAERDVSDYLLMSYCLENDIPLLGLCRGMQMLSVVSGAEAIQDIPTYFENRSLDYNFEHRRPEQPRDFASNNVRVVRNSLLYDITQKNLLRGVPCWHHQAIENVDDTRLKISGYAATGGINMIEAVERTDKTFALGLQFHPEAALVKNLDNAADRANFLDYDTALEFFKRLANAKAASLRKAA